MADSLFPRGFVYPRDDYGGDYIELEGVVLKRRVADGDDPFSVDVQTLRGRFYAFAKAYFDEFVFVGGWARVRVYNSGGGWYPDDRVMAAGPWRISAPDRPSDPPPAPPTGRTPPP